jgi:HEAT repeats/PBS lyase HEAT-like repeat
MAAAKQQKWLVECKKGADIMMLFSPFSNARTVSESTDIASERPPIGTTPPQILVQEAANGRRGAAWRLLHRIVENDPRAVEAATSLDDDRLACYLLEWIALGTWADRPFVAPLSLRSPYARMHLSTLFLANTGITAPRAERVLISAVHDSRPALRKTAASILGLLGSANATLALIEALGDPLYTVQYQAVKALGRIGDASAVPALLNLLPSADTQLRSMIFSSLGEIGSSAVPALIELSTSSSPWRRWHCIRALGNTRDIRALPVLVNTLADTDQSVAWMAAKGLVPFGARSVEPVLYLLMSAGLTPWLVETASYVLNHQHDARLKHYLKPLLWQMHQTSFYVGTILYAQKIRSQLIAEGIIKDEHAFLRKT